jgi:hypothetical protein
MIGWYYSVTCSANLMNRPNAANIASSSGPVIFYGFGFVHNHCRRDLYVIGRVA